MADVQDQPAATTEETSRSARAGEQTAPVLVRGVIFVALLVVADLWGSHHLGVGIRDPGPLAAGIAAVTAALGWLDKVSGGSAKATVTRAAQRLIRAALATPVLVACWMLALIAGFTYSSVIVIPSSSEGSFRAALTPLDRPAETEERVLREGESFLRFFVTTGPFGRPFRVKVPGYVSEVVQVPPLSGTTLRPYRQFRPSPSVLLRPPPAALGHLEDGHIDVWILQGDKRASIGRVRGKGSSFLIGTASPALGDLQERWRLELLAQGLQGQALASVLLAWSHPTILNPEFELEPGMRLGAEVTTQGGVIVARAEHTLGAEELADVRMLALGE